MVIVSVSLTSELQHRLDTLVSEGVGNSRADVMCRALERFAEEEAVNAVLRAEREVASGKVLRGDAHRVLRGK